MGGLRFELRSSGPKPESIARLAQPPADFALIQEMLTLNSHPTA